MHSEVRDANPHEESALLDAVRKKNSDEIKRLVCRESSFGSAILWKNAFEKMTQEEQTFARSTIDEWIRSRDAEMEVLDRGEWLN